MASLPASITINDGTATPVAVVFTPIAANGGSVTFADKRKAAKTFWPKLTVSFDGETKQRRTDHVDVSFEYPMTQTVDGVEVVYATARFERGRFILPSGMPQADRKHIYAFVRNGLGVSVVQGLVNDLDPIFG